MNNVHSCFEVFRVLKMLSWKLCGDKKVTPLLPRYSRYGTYFSTYKQEENGMKKKCWRSFSRDFLSAFFSLFVCQGQCHSSRNTSLTFSPTWRVISFFTIAWTLPLSLGLSTLIFLSTVYLSSIFVFLSIIFVYFVLFLQSKVLPSSSFRLFVSFSIELNELKIIRLFASYCQYFHFFL